MKNSLTKASLLAAFAAVSAIGQCKIDGALHPDAIPDEIAYRMMFNMLKLGPKEPTAYYSRRVNAYLGSIGLNNSDRDPFWSVLKTYTAQADAQDQKLQALLPAQRSSQSPSPEATALYNQQLALVLQARQALSASLSAPGAAAVAKHIAEQVKPRTVMPCPK